MLTAHGVTHPGRVRKINEDAVLTDLPLGLFVVADGMGGHNAGEVASKLAVEAIRGFLARTADGDDFTWPFGLNRDLSLDANRLMTSIKLANRRVFKEGESRDDYTGMGTTVVAALVEGDRLIYSNVGDSRLYLFAGGKLSQLTRDDTWVATVLARDPHIDEATIAAHPMRHVLTNVIGAREQMDMDVNEHKLKTGEVLLLCSDGLHGAVDDRTIERLIAPAAEGQPVERVAQALVDAALEGSASDNISALVVRYAAG